MNGIVTFRKTGIDNIPAVVSVCGHETPVWLQSDWQNGQYAQYVRMNGCGHCCCAMAAMLHGVDIDPHREIEYCVKVHGVPDEAHDWYQSAGGIAEILRSLGVSAAAYGVVADEAGIAAAGERIDRALASGHPVIFWSHPYTEANPFSTGEHYVMAVGYDEQGRILIANSGTNKTRDGVQFVDMQTVLDSLYKGSTAENTGWGCSPFSKSAGFVIV